MRSQRMLSTINKSTRTTVQKDLTHLKRIRCWKKEAGAPRPQGYLIVKPKN